MSLPDNRLTRREMIRLSALGCGAAWLSTQCSLLGLGKGPGFESPPTSRFPGDWELPIPPRIAASGPVTITQKEALHTFHPDLPPSAIWGYDGLFPGPTLTARVGSEARVSFVNDLPRDAKGFGVPRTAVHLHGGHQPSEHDGFPTDFFTRGDAREYVYPNSPPGGDEREIASTTWYHDHVLDFTAQNVYKGLAGFYLLFDERDNDDETDGSGLQLPAGAFDVPLSFADRLFHPDTGALAYDPFDHDGFLGDRTTVNGRIMPTLPVLRRKYRFRFLNAANARFFHFFLRREGDARTVPDPFVQIATDGGLLPHPVPLSDFLLTNGERVEVIVDFSRFREGEEIILENRLYQWDGRGKNRLRRPDEAGDELLKFRIGPAPKGGDPSRVPDTLRALPDVPTNLPDEPDETLVLDRKSGVWVINEKHFDPDTPLVTSVRNRGVVWRMINDTSFWFHPMHAHLEFFQVLRRNGEAPPPSMRGKKDTVLLGPRDELDLYFRFRDFPGKYVLHCHNLEHEDMSMMARYDVV